MSEPTCNYCKRYDCKMAVNQCEYQDGRCQYGSDEGEGHDHYFEPTLEYLLEVMETNFQKVLGKIDELKKTMKGE